MNDRIEQLLSWLSALNQPDKLQHFFYGYFIFKLSSLFAGVYIALVIVTIIAVAKELRDRKQPYHNASLLDIFYTILPGVIDTTIVYLT